jgi:hypothetical protein
LINIEKYEINNYLYGTVYYSRGLQLVGHWIVSQHFMFLSCTEPIQSTSPHPRLAAGGQMKYFSEGLNSNHAVIHERPSYNGKYRRLKAKSGIYTEQCG